jgi:GNAT superfamily N-acetyltransferase
MTAKPTPAPAAAATDPKPLTAVTVELLKPPAADDPTLVEHIAALINSVYAAAERGLWRDHAQRITAAEVAQHIRSGEVAVARAREEIVGSIRVWDLVNGRSEFGLLVTAPEHRGLGVGSALIAFAERHSRDRGRRAMRLELLAPRGWTHPDKQRLDAWYRRIGYRAMSTASVTSVHPRLAPQLACPCDFVVYEKPLATPSDDRRRAAMTNRHQQEDAK